MRAMETMNDKVNPKTGLADSATLLKAGKLTMGPVLKNIAGKGWGGAPGGSGDESGVKAKAEMEEKERLKFLVLSVVQ
eukprot:1365856-Amorphochlora_amoeboformis.AAC.1